MFRTLLFIPGNNERFIKKSLGLDADILCYDLEDSVPVKEKDVARDLLKMYFREQKVDNIRSSIYVRINSSESG
ncbi:MAG TPA: aldolase/citrate lyase family protein, partial [Nitrososphaeraceae archaeon]|nr:aldolase/citrate lyase family protein [Nitrososphaeraceae archaeon]